MKLREALIARHERAIEEVNRQLNLMRDQMLLDKAECESLLEVINERLPGECNPIAHRLRFALITAMDVINAEDGIAKMDSYQPDPPKFPDRPTYQRDAN